MNKSRKEININFFFLPVSIFSTQNSSTPAVDSDFKTSQATLHESLKPSPEVSPLSQHVA